MSRKIFLSFLGTNDYVDCNYFLEENPDIRIDDVKYIQEAIIKIHKSDLSEDDVCYFFLTEDAKHRNWEDNGQFNKETRTYSKPNKGLNARLQELKTKGELKAGIQFEDIPEGFSSEEIWTIFQKIVDIVHPGDIIYLDITHAFRSIPMLGMVLMNYLKALHGVEVKAIYYGAFEKLGFAGQVQNMPIEQRNAPILNLISFSILQNWTNAAYDFISYGNANNFVQLANNEINPLLRSKSDRTEVARKINVFVQSLKNVVENLQTNRGRNIVQGEIFARLMTNIDSISEDLFIIPMKPLISKVKEKVKNFSSQEDWKNGLHAVKWCIDHNMIQQGITLLQETIITYYCILNQLDYKREQDRQLVNDCFYIKGMGIEHKEKDWSKIARINEKQSKTILSKLDKRIVDDFQSLSQGGRNDINHGGFTRNATPTALKVKLENSYELFCNSLGE